MPSVTSLRNFFENSKREFEISRKVNYEKRPRSFIQFDFDDVQLNDAPTTINIRRKGSLPMQQSRSYFARQNTSLKDSKACSKVLEAGVETYELPRVKSLLELFEKNKYKQKLRARKESGMESKKRKTSGPDYMKEYFEHMTIPKEVIKSVMNTNSSGGINNFSPVDTLLNKANTISLNSPSVSIKFPIKFGTNDKNIRKQSKLNKPSNSYVSFPISETTISYSESTEENITLKNITPCELNVSSRNSSVTEVNTSVVSVKNMALLFENIKENKEFDSSTPKHNRKHGATPNKNDHRSVSPLHKDEIQKTKSGFKKKLAEYFDETSKKTTEKNWTNETNTFIMNKESLSNEFQNESSDYKMNANSEKNNALLNIILDTKMTDEINEKKKKSSTELLCVSGSSASHISKQISDGTEPNSKSTVENIHPSKSIKSLPPIELKFIQIESILKNDQINGANNDLPIKSQKLNLKITNEYKSKVKNLKNIFMKNEEKDSNAIQSSEKTKDSNHSIKRLPKSFSEDLSSESNSSVTDYQLISSKLLLNPKIIDYSFASGRTDRSFCTSPLASKMDSVLRELKPDEVNYFKNCSSFMKFDTIKGKNRTRSSSVASSSPTSTLLNLNFMKSKLRSSTKSCRGLHPDELKYFGLNTRGPTRADCSAKTSEPTLQQRVLKRTSRTDSVNEDKKSNS